MLQAIILPSGVLIHVHTRNHKPCFVWAVSCVAQIARTLVVNLNFFIVEWFMVVFIPILLCFIEMPNLDIRAHLSCEVPYAYHCSIHDLLVQLPHYIFFVQPSMFQGCCMCLGFNVFIRVWPWFSRVLGFFEILVMGNLTLQSNNILLIPSLALILIIHGHA